MCTFEPEKPEASVDRGARELPLSPGHDPSKTSSFLACNKRYVKCIKSKSFGSLCDSTKPQSQKYAKIHPKEFTFGSTTL